MSGRGEGSGRGLHMLMAGRDLGDEGDECAVRLSGGAGQLCERLGKGEAVLMHHVRVCLDEGGTEL